MEVIYRTTDGLYPFNLNKKADLAYVEDIVKVDSNEESAKYRDISRIYRGIVCPHLIKLNKVLKDDNQMHFVYEYHSTSLEVYMAKKPHSQLKRLQAEIGCALNCLQNAKLKAQIRVENVGVDDEGQVKLFVSLWNEEVNSDLHEFYTTERTRLKLQLEQIWERFQSNKEEGKSQKNPGFIISGNELIFTNNENNQNMQGATNQPQIILEKKQLAHPTLTEYLRSQIQKQREIADQLKSKRLVSKGETTQTFGEDSSKKQPKYNPNIKTLESTEKISPKKKQSTNSQYNPKRQSHRNSTSAGISIKNLKNVEDRMTNSQVQQNDFNFCRIEDRPQSSINCLNSERRQSFRSHDNLSYQQIRAIANKHLEGDIGQDAKIQVTTQMVSKYKMKIVTCQQIQFQGKQGDDIQKLAQEKLIEYQNQHGLPQMMLENSNHSASNQHLITRDKTEKSGSYEEYRQEKDAGKNDNNQNQEIMAKIMKSKEKASSVLTFLKQYAKNKRK